MALAEASEPAREAPGTRMEQPVVIVTGASMGLGAALASIAAEHGARIVAAARSQARLQALAEQIRQRGGDALAVCADVSSYDDCRRIVEAAGQAFGRIDALINNAAVIEPFAPVAEADGEDWARHLAVNLIGPVMMCQLAIPHLRLTKGRVINVTSRGADAVVPGASAYSASKAALNRVSKILAAEEPAITVIPFIPGDVDTPMQATIRAKAKGKTPDEIYAYFVEVYEQGRLLPPETPARAAVALALKAPREWSGEILAWDDERVQELVRML